MVGTLEHLR